MLSRQAVAGEQRFFTSTPDCHLRRSKAMKSVIYGSIYGGTSLKSSSCIGC